MPPSKRTDEERAAIAQIGARIRARRRAKKIKAIELAYLTGMNLEHLHALERGEHKPRSYTLSRIAKVLGVSVEELETGKKPRNGNGGRS